jgi:DNA methylase
MRGTILLHKVPALPSIAPTSLRRIAALANSPRRDRGATRAIYSYPAKFQAHLPAELIRLFTRPGDLVVDPYSGGGTTGLEALLAGRRFFGADLNPFACLIARVKTTPLAVAPVETALAAVLACRARRAVPVLDEEDARCLGARVSGDIERLAAGVDAVPDAAARDLLLLSLIHAIKIAGRRDFDDVSLVPLYRHRVARNAAAVAALPMAPAVPAPRFVCRSNHALPEVADGAAQLLVTSPPYKDLDVEYALLQIQRPALHRSKRSRAIFALLGIPPVDKKRLCGGVGAEYWPQLAASLREIHRLLAPHAPAFFWIGFKTPADRADFERHLAAAGLPLIHAIRAALGRDRVASSRSTHHGRDTGMLGQDFLLLCQRA